jgi:Protein of unknown function (DUF5674)
MRMRENGDSQLILIINTRATHLQITQMLQEHKFYIKVVVDIELHILAGGGEMHYDEEKVLLDNGSRQQDIWGAGFMPSNQNIRYDSMINLRQSQNRSMEILDATIRERVAQIIMEFLGEI